MGWESISLEGHTTSGYEGGSLKCEVFGNFVRMKVGRGDRVRFWKDIWCGEVSLEAAFPSIFQLAGKKDGSVHKHYILNDDRIIWHLHLRRNLNDWEIGEAMTLNGSVKRP